MKEIPILFSTPMVQAIMAGRKTQTRRLMKPQPGNCNHSDFQDAPWKNEPPMFIESAADPYHWYCRYCGNGVIANNDYKGIRCRYGKPSDLLWVRETWGVGSRPDPFEGSIDGIEFKADSKFIDDIESLPLRRYEVFDYGNYDKSGWRPSIHMPKAIARIWLQVTYIRVERLHDITEEDAQAEGVERLKGAQWKDESTGVFRDYTHKDSFELLWQSINGPDSWAANPWVWVLSFKVLSTTGKLAICPKS